MAMRRLEVHGREVERTAAVDAPLRTLRRRVLPLEMREVLRVERELARGPLPHVPGHVEAPVGGRALGEPPDGRRIEVTVAVVAPVRAPDALRVGSRDAGGPLGA